MTSSMKDDLNGFVRVCLKGQEMMFDTMRLCEACYYEVPSHKIEGQFKSAWRCDNYRLKLLSKCPRCGKKLKITAM